MGKTTCNVQWAVGLSLLENDVGYQKKDTDQKNKSCILETLLCNIDMVCVLYKDTVSIETCSIQTFTAQLNR